VKDADGNVVELRCTYDPATRGGNAPDGRKVKATIHWVSADHAVDVAVNRYDRLFTVEDLSKIPEGKDYKEYLNPQSLVLVPNVKAEPALASVKPGETFQFERLGYFCVDLGASGSRTVFNRVVTLKDEWAKIEKRASGPKKG
jgi:glutaminyl-tRNA synthetase